MINKIDNTSFQSRYNFIGYSTHTPKMKDYKEFYFMPELQTKNPIKKFFQDMIEMIKGIKKSMKPEQDVAAKSTGMSFEA